MVFALLMYLSRPHCKYLFGKEKIIFTYRFQIDQIGPFSFVHKTFLILATSFPWSVVKTSFLLIISLFNISLSVCIQIVFPQNVNVKLSCSFSNFLPMTYATSIVVLYILLYLFFCSMFA